MVHRQMAYAIRIFGHFEALGDLMGRAIEPPS